MSKTRPLKTKTELTIHCTRIYPDTVPSYRQRQPAPTVKLFDTEDACMHWIKTKAPYLLDPERLLTEDAKQKAVFTWDVKTVRR